MNPNDYDPDELRGAGEPPEGVFLGGSGAGGGGSGAPPIRADEVLQSNQYRELFLLERTTGEGGLEKPYLDSLPQSYAAEVTVFEWLEFLVDKAGFRGTMDALRYYRSIEWLTDDAESRLREYLTSFDEGGDGADLDRSDHLLSLVYLARLAAMD